MKQIIIPILFMLAALPTFAEENTSSPHKRPDINEMHERKWRFILEETHLNEEKARKIKPLFMEFEKSSWQLHEKVRSQFKEVHLKMAKKEPVDYDKLNDSAVGAEIEQAGLLEKYHTALKLILSPEELFGFYRAEHKFKKILLQNISKRKGRM
ncbi:MAG: hypothetical protein LBH80_00380 [Prevotellaceae bacterium]|jgi:hypothetical protein|nr:hypothetical protein [Prevotellaceae bacterium]